RRLYGENTLPASGGGWSSGDWGLLRDIIYVLDHYQAVAAPWENICPYVGEALFFRAIFYFGKLRNFGDVPWSSTTVDMDSETLFAPRMPRNQVADSILHDLDLAVEYLPARGGGSWTGRVTKETALALQARIALYEGTWERYHGVKNTQFKVAGSDGAKFIRKAADAAGALIALAEVNGYPALDNAGVENGYWFLFNQKDYANHREVLLWRKYSVAEGQYHRWINYTSNGGGRGITKSMVDSYLCTDGKPIAGNPLYQGDQDLKSLVANRDPRLNQTIQVDDGRHLVWMEPEVLFTTPSFGSLNESKSVTGYQLYKGHTADYAEQQAGVNSTSGQIYFRYAETLLIYAEAKAELGTVTQTDIDKTVNALRRRVGMDGGLLDIGSITTDPNWEFAGLSPVLQEIRRERKVELACEGFRVDDIFRWAAADELIAGKRPLGAVKKQWENYPDASVVFLDAVAILPVNAEGYIDPYKDYGVLDAGFRFNLGRDYLSPIPTTEIVLNPNLTQNPGW
ncbi:MAG: RagB/SusD family nutrient uptake outer membrane protein, partial [Tannerella sp.]|nr:RagB/SusD family nutrient uptake outer membrane protein [Tannerella sp.]